MTSEERHAARRARREAAREAKRRKRNAPYDDFERVFRYENLYRSYRLCRRGVAWKSSTQKYITNAPLEVYRVRKRVLSGKYRSPGFYEFDLYERGRKRHIRSTVIGERVVQRCLCDYALIPVLTPTLIHDNGATMKNKGYDFAIRRFDQHVREAHRRHGKECWVLMYDFSKFFDSIPHWLLSDIIRREFRDLRIVELTEHLIGMFGDVGLGLGSQISQVLALTSANRIDHMMKERMRIHWCGRYMDDGNAIHHDRAHLELAKSEVISLATQMGFRVNEKKTSISRLDRVTWLKTRYSIPEDKVVKKIYRRSVTKQRQKVKKMRHLLAIGKIAPEDVGRNISAWIGYAGRFNSYHTVQSMTALCNELFGKEVMRYVHQGRRRHRRTRPRGNP